MRQPHAENVAALWLRRVAPITTSAKSIPTVAVVWIQAVAYPRR